MPLKKKVTRTTSGGYMITLPKQWVDNVIKQQGEELTEILMEINGELKITPVFSTKPDAVRDKMVS